VINLKEEQRHLDRVDGSKMFFDLFKHLTTLSTGSILLMAAFLEKLFKNPNWSFLVSITFVCFILAIISSLAGMITYSAKVIASHDEDTDLSKPLLIISVFGGFGCFLIGVTSLVIFALKNFN
jgi:hypothetical protein